MKNLTNIKNQQFYEELISNLYYTEFKGCGGNAIRGKSVEEVATQNQNKNYELKGVHKLNLREGKIGELFEVIGLIHLIITTEDENSLHGELIRSTGDYEFTLSQLNETYLQQLMAMGALIKKLKKIEKHMNLRLDAINLFEGEVKQLNKKSA